MVPVVYPQQATDQSSRIAQVCDSPAAIGNAVLPVPNDAVSEGVFLVVVVPSPSWPFSCSSPNMRRTRRRGSHKKNQTPIPFAMVFFRG